MSGKKKTYSGMAVFLTLVLLLGLTVWQSKDRLERRWLYPWPFEETVFYYAGKNNIDPYLVASVINNESRFRATAKSERGAIGLMQLMPDTASWVAGEMGLGALSSEALVEPDTNIRLGCWYLGELLHEFGGNEVLALAAYNAGRGTVRQWMKENEWDASFRATRLIPYDETRVYVEKVLSDKRKYNDLYWLADGSDRRKNKKG